MKKFFYLFLTIFLILISIIYDKYFSSSSNLIISNGIYNSNENNLNIISNEISAFELNILNTVANNTIPENINSKNSSSYSNDKQTSIKRSSPRPNSNINTYTPHSNSDSLNEPNIEINSDLFIDTNSNIQIKIDK